MIVLPLKDLLCLLFGDVQPQISQWLPYFHVVDPTWWEKTPKIPGVAFPWYQILLGPTGKKVKITLPSLFLSKLLKVSFSFFSCSCRYLLNSAKSSPSSWSLSPEEIIFWGETVYYPPCTLRSHHLLLLLLSSLHLAGSRIMQIFSLPDLRSLVSLSLWGPSELLQQVSF